MSGRVDSYDRNAVRPKPGTLWVWEPGAPHATALIKVESVLWNGQEWWVGTRTVMDCQLPDSLRRTGTLWNDLSRFWEACHRVAAEPGPGAQWRQDRRGEPQPDELADVPA